MTQQEALIRSMASSGNLFLLLTLPEMRRQGLTYLAFYALQRIVKEGALPEFLLRQETGLEDYEVSRACTFLAKSGLAEIRKADYDKRVRFLKSTARGRGVVDKVMSAAARRFDNAVLGAGRIRRLAEATQHLKQGNQILLGPLQLSFFDSDLLDDDSPKRPNKKRRTGKLATGRAKRSKP
jgi:DNA-binding MarR family transcriptional regulator